MGTLKRRIIEAKEPKEEPPMDVRGWIPVSERLPEKGVPVIGWFPGATQSFECSLNEHDGVWCDYGTGIYLYENERPTHWMPFPDGPTDAK